MKKIIFQIFFIIFILLILFIFFLSTIGVETKRFNKIIEGKVSTLEKKVTLKLDKIKIKIDLSEFRLFLSTKNPDLKYEKNEIPIQNLKVYVKLSSLIKTKIDIEKANIHFDEIKVEKIKRIILRIKPSNLKTLLLNNLKSGIVQAKLDLDFEENLKLKSYLIEGNTKKLKINIFDKYQLENIKFQFSINNQVYSLQNIYGKINNIDIENGKIKIDNSTNLNINGTAVTNFNLDQNQIKKLLAGNINSNLLENDIKINSKLKNTFNISFDKKFKIQDYTLSIEGISKKSNIFFTNPFDIQFIEKEIKQISFNDIKISFLKSFKKENILKLDGVYNINDGNFKKFSFKNIFNKNISKYNFNVKISEIINIQFLNYFKDTSKDANLGINFSILNDKLNVKQLKFTEDKNLININNLILDKKFNLFSFKDIIIKTFNKDIKNNDFKVSSGKKIIVSGEVFDASKLGKLLNNTSKSNSLKNINKNIIINFSNINTKLTNQIQNFNLIGSIENGKLIKISSKGELGENKYIDIKLYKDKKIKKSFLEIYSDEPQILLSDYNFFKGIQGGKILYNLEFDDTSSVSSILIEKFKVKDAPGFVKLLSLADFGGLADLVSGDGLSFDTLEIKLNKNKKILNLNELFALGPSVSILMNGYVENESGLVSLRGTMVPAKELNKLISKIPLIGDILIPKQIGEGLFGVSFKMKGVPGKIKTTVDPIKTLTPRFIIKAIEKVKNTK